MNLLDGDKLLAYLKNRADILISDMATAIDDDQLTDEISFRLHEIMLTKTAIKSGDYTIDKEGNNDD